MKHFKHTFLLTVLMSMVGAKGLAHDIEVKNADGVTIYYRYNSDKTSVYVTYRGGYHYSYSNEYTGVVNIPSFITYNGKEYSVTSIDGSAFQGCSSLTSITIPNSVTEIGDAFYGCSSLTAVTINSNTIVSKAYTSSSSLKDIFGTQVKKYVIGDGVTSIGYKTFYGCTGLTSVTIPNSVTSIGNYAFYDCSGLNAITIPNSVKSIGNYAFQGCSSLTSVTIPNSITSIGYKTFYGCSGLTTVAIPNSVKSIGNYAFYGCSGLTSITIPNSVTNIGDYAFNNTRLKSVTIGTGVLSIGTNVFSDGSSSNGERPVKVIWLTNTPPTNYSNAAGYVNYVANNQYSLSNMTVYPFLSSMFEVDGVKYVPVSPSERTCDAIDCAYDASAEKIHIGNTINNKGISLTVKEVKP